jgi:hypothetical protein
MTEMEISAFTGGINEKLRPDLLAAGECQEFYNLSVGKAGVVVRAYLSDESSYSLPDLGDVARFWLWKPRHMPSGSSGKDFVFVMQTTAGGIYLVYYDGSVWVASAQLLSLALARSAETALGLIFCDGREGNTLREIWINSHGEILAGEVGVPAPAALASLRGGASDNSYVLNSSNYPGMSIRQGSILFFSYTMVCEDGVEGNPSPLLVEDKLNYLLQDEEGGDAGIWQRCVFDGLRAVMADLDSSPNLREKIKYFYIYMASTPFSEDNLSRGVLKRAGRIPISALDGSNSYVSSSAFLGKELSYENDQGCKGDGLVSTAGVVMVQNANVAIKFSHSFAQYIKITLSNKNSKNYCNGRFWLRLSESDLVDRDGSEVIDWSTLFDGSADLIDPEKIRFYDNDLTTMLPTLYNYSVGATYLDVELRIPYVAANQPHDIYLVWGGDGVPSAIPGGTEFYDWRYGQWEDVSEAVAQELWWANRVRSSKQQVCCSCEDHQPGSVRNRASGNHDGEFSGMSEVYWVSDRFERASRLGLLGNLFQPCTDNKNAIKVEHGNSNWVDFDNLIIGENSAVLFWVKWESTAAVHQKSICTIVGDSPEEIRIGLSSMASSAQIEVESENDDGSASFSGQPLSGNSAFICLQWRQGSARLWYYDVAAGSAHSVNISTFKYPSGGKSLRFRNETDGAGDTSGDGDITFSQFVLENDLWLDETGFLSYRDISPYFPAEEIGMKADESGNNNVEFAAMEEILYDTQRGMLKYSSLGGRTFPDGNYIFTAEPQLRLMPAPNFLSNGEYLNSLLIFGNNGRRERFLLRGGPEGWNGQLGDLLVQEQSKYGLLSREGIIKIGDSIIYSSAAGIYRESMQGRQRLDEKLDLDEADKRSAKFMYDAMNDKLVMTSKSRTALLNMQSGVWEEIDPLTVAWAQFASGTSEESNKTIYLPEAGETLREYPGVTRANVNHLTSGKIKIYKTIRKIYIDGEVGSVLLTVYNKNFIGDKIAKSVSLGSEKCNKWIGLGAGYRAEYLEIKIINISTFNRLLLGVK